MFHKKLIEERPPLGQPLERAGLIGTREAAVALDFGRKNCDQPPFGIARFGQDMPSDRTG